MTKIRARWTTKAVATAMTCAFSACGGGEGSADDESSDMNPSTSATSGGTPETSGPTPPAMSTGAGGDSSGTTGGESDGATTISPPLFDFSMPDAPPVDTQCTQVDFLFVIDNSGSMSSYQANLIANFPNFIDGIQNSLDGVDTYQVGVITTDQYSNNIAGCNNLSSLVVQSAGGACGPYADGNNFMTESDNLATTFSCAGNVGSSGNGLELPMQAMVEAVQKVDGGPGQCNEDFLRDDSLLVIVIITDEYDGPGDPEFTSSPGDPNTWYEDVVDARGGIPENIVVLSLINYVGGLCPPGSPYDDGVHIATFTSMFEDNGFLGGICEPDYGPIFNEAIGVIDDACENFMPPQG